MAIGGLTDVTQNSTEGILNNMGVLDGSGLIDSFIQAIGPFFIKLSVVLGGVGLLYLILILVRVYYEREKVQLLKDIRYNQIQINKHYGVRYTMKKKSWIKRFFNFFRRF